MKDKNREICRKIREIRKAMKLTQSQFAELCDMSEDSIGKIERGVTFPTVETLYKIARNVNKPIEAILPSPSAYNDKFCRGLPKELTELVDYLRSRTPADAKFMHELAVTILERKK